MGLKIHHEIITPEIANALRAVCPFDALDYTDGKLSLNSACKACKLCVKKGPAGAITWEEEQVKQKINKADWNGILVYADRRGDKLHPVTLELIGKAKELAKEIHHPVYALLIGSDVQSLADELLHYDVDKVFVYEHTALASFNIAVYANVFYDLIQKVRPSSILVGATNAGRSLAPRVAARCETGLTADCTVLKMKENTDLVQIRPAFGGNIMAQIVTPNARPQFCTVRYRVFSAPARSESPSGSAIDMTVTEEMLKTSTEILEITEKPKQIDISDADVIVACGRGFKSEADLSLAKELAEKLHAQLACTRPLIEAGWMDPRRQIGLSGRTVKPKLILTLGVSGSVQFAAGMKGSDLIIAVNNDPSANIFDIAHIGIVGDLYEIIPQLLNRINGGAFHVS